MTDQTGKTYDLPTYTATQTYSPENQAIYDQSQASKLGLATLANTETQKIGGILGTNLDLSSANIDNYTNTHYQDGFNNQWDRDSASLDQKLADQGIQVGSQAYSNAQHDFSTNKQAASDQYLGDMYNNAQNAIITQRQQPINEIDALMSGSQISAPSFTNTPTTQLPTVDQAGLINQNYQDQEGQYQQQVATQNAAMGGLFGLAGAGLGGWATGGFKMSDRRLKTNIERVGTLRSGLPVYDYDYIWGGARETGVMADEAIQFFPAAIAEGPGGFSMVAYERIA